MNMKMQSIISTRNQILILEAERWLGVQEHGGNNRGEIVSMFQRAIGRAVNEPWCMSFVQYCCMEVDRWANKLLNQNIENQLNKSEHCMTVWRETPKGCRLSKPVPGCVPIWNFAGTDDGHTGIAKAFDRQIIIDIEGNTSDDSKTIVREGHGVRKKRRPMRSIGKMNLVGFLDPWAGLS